MRMIWSALGLICLLIVMSMGCGGNDTAETGTEGGSTVGGTKQPDVVSERFTLSDIHGQRRCWSDYTGRPLAINFWATWCVPCRQEIPILKKLYQEYNPRGFEIIGISVDQDQRKVKPFVEEMQIPWDVLYTAGRTLKEFEIGQAIPMTIFFDAQGNETGRIFGAQAEYDFHHEIEKLFPAGS